MAIILKMFLVDGPANFTNGCATYIYKGSHKIYTATLAGIIGDEKGLKEFFDIKGQEGWKVCMSCANVFNFLHKDGTRARSKYELGIDVVDRIRIYSHGLEESVYLHL